MKKELEELYETIFGGMFSMIIYMSVCALLLFLGIIINSEDLRALAIFIGFPIPLCMLLYPRFILALPIIVFPTLLIGFIIIGARCLWIKCTPQRQKFIKLNRKAEKLNNKLSKLLKDTRE